MTKSRRLPALLFLVVAGPLPAMAQGAVPSTLSSIIVAPPDPLGDVAAQHPGSEQRCRFGGLDGVTVCGRPVRAGNGYRIPYEPEPGTRVRLIAGEMPSATSAMSADHCIRLCYQPVMLDLFHPSTIARGIDRILSGD